LVQPILFFALGFLCAGFLALLVAPAIWRRAVALTRRRIEGALPMTLSEIQADKDRLRAEFAMSVRKLEMTIKTFREKSAEQLVEIGRSREALTALDDARVVQDQALADLRGANEALDVELRQRAEQVKTLSDKLAASERAATERSLEIERLGQMYDEASFSASSRQIELVARESEREKLADDLTALREQHKNTVQHRQQMEVQSRLAENTLTDEKKKSAALNRKLERLMATLADRDDKLDRREKELARLRQFPLGLAAAEASGGKDGEIEKAIAKLDAARERLEDKLTTLARENKKLKAELSGLERSKPGAADAELPDAASLREQMHELAAEVVNLTARLDGPDSPIAKALAAPEEQEPSGESGARMISLAERVRALQKAASTG
jgi:chromosome segregation ATPase